MQVSEWRCIPQTDETKECFIAFLSIIYLIGREIHVDAVVVRRVICHLSERDPLPRRVLFITIFFLLLFVSVASSVAVTDHTTNRSHAPNLPRWGARPKDCGHCQGIELHRGSYWPEYRRTERQRSTMLAIRDSFTNNSDEATTSSIPSGRGREERTSSVVRMRHPGLLTRPLSMNKSSSSPALKHLCMNATDGDLEVYVVLRNFQEFGGGIFHKLPEPLRNGLRDSGVCHYMTVFKQQDGTMVQFDFGPAVGGDIHISGPGPFNKSKKERKRAVVGQVREKKLQAMPEAHMFVGKTTMSLSEIRAWNNVHAASEYELHRSDCRHYVNALVRYTTGIESAAISALRHQVAQHSDSGKLSKQMIRLGQYFTDAANWDRVRAIGHATSAAIMTLAGQQTLARFGAVPIFRSVGSKVIPASARGALVPVKKALFHRPVYAMSTAAVASTISTSQEVSARTAPAGIRRNMVQTIQSAVRVAANFADTMSKTASNFVQGAVRRPTRVAQQISEQPRVRKGPFFLGATSDSTTFGHHVQHLAMIASRR